MKKYSGLQKLDGNISKIIKPISKKKKDNFAILAKLSKNWKTIVGEKYHKYCIPHKIKLSKANNQATLSIVSYNSAIAFALEGNKNQIIEKIAAYFGYKVICGIRITQDLKEISLKTTKKKLKLDEKSEKLIKEETKEIKDQDLQKILQKLGESILGKSE
jgi:hypothetical protein